MIDQIIPPNNSIPNFIETKEYKKFEEFADDCMQYQYIGICYGEPGVGKSLAANYYAKWDEGIETVHPKDEISAAVIQKVDQCKAALWVAPVCNTPKSLALQIEIRIRSYGTVIYKSKGEENEVKLILNAPKLCPLLIVDEADQLKFNSFEQLRQLYDKYQFGLILIGMSGFERRLSRYPQLYSRIGFSHQFCKLSRDEMRFIFEKKWEEFGTTFNPEYFPDVEAINTLIRVTQGNFRLIERMFCQMKRIAVINHSERITKELVDTARDCLVIGTRP